MSVEAFTFDRHTYTLKVINQTLLPNKLVHEEIQDVSGAYDAIKYMWVRGAPCIAAVGCLSIVVELNNSTREDLHNKTRLIEWLLHKSMYLISSRPTAVNLKQALDKLECFTRNCKLEKVDDIKIALTQFCIDGIDKGRQANLKLGDIGARHLLDPNPNQCFTVLTHCNTGSLATVGHGTALGVIRTLHKLGKLEIAYCTETRPYNQGSRLTAWELLTENVPCTLIADNMVAHLMTRKNVDAVLVGADRVAENGDTANKIGTLQIAVLAHHFGIPFYVVAPSQSIDSKTKRGPDMVIEERPPDELRVIGSATEKIQLAPREIPVWNPCFDITPAHMITNIFTEYGVTTPQNMKRFLERIRAVRDVDEALF